jgi:hypothetical protein
LHYGLADLDAGGVWIQSADLGPVWKPKVQQGWVPYRNGRWQWYDGLGYTWIADDSWGWLPYHYGRWTFQQPAGWLWVPGEGTVFLPGEVYWLKTAKVVGWGPLAFNENWKPPETPRLFQNILTTYAAYKPEMREIDPAGFTARPEDPLPATAFALALPSPAFPAARLDAFRPQLRAGSTHPVPVAGSVALDGHPEPAPAPQDQIYRSGAPSLPPAAIVNSPPPDAAPVEVDYGIPVYMGIIVVNPPGSKPLASRIPPKSGSPPLPKPPKPRIPEPEKPVK